MFFGILFIVFNFALQSDIIMVSSYGAVGVVAFQKMFMITILGKYCSDLSTVSEGN